MKLENPPLDLELDEKFALKIAGEAQKADIRTLKQMLDVLQDPEAAKTLPQETATYYMYRDVKRAEDAALLGNMHLRYDITAIPALKIGKEFNKTYGHYHQMATSSLSYPELYEVLQGEALYMLQHRLSPVSNEVRSVFLVHAKAGDKVLIPPNFGHATINASPETLVMDNINEWKFKSDYSLYKQKHGAAYYALEGEKRKNPNYQALPPLKEMPARQFNRLVNPVVAMKLEEDRTYSLFLRKPQLFGFLKEPMQVEFRQ